MCLPLHGSRPYHGEGTYVTMKLRAMREKGGDTGCPWRRFKIVGRMAREGLGYLARAAFIQGDFGGNYVVFYPTETPSVRSLHEEVLRVEETR